MGQSSTYVFMVDDATALRAIRCDDFFHRFLHSNRNYSILCECDA